MTYTAQKVWVFDLDGTLADLTHRLHYIEGEVKNWDAFFAAVGEDSVIEHMRELFWACQKMYQPIIVSGRSDVCRDKTEAWLHYNFLSRTRLYMRRHGDHRPDVQVKRDLLGDLRGDGYEPIMVFDDRNQTVKGWRDLGVPCAQVAPGDF